MNRYDAILHLRTVYTSFFYDFITGTAWGERQDKLTADALRALGCTEDEIKKVVEKAR